jgi:hypothetical protein
MKNIVKFKVGDKVKRVKYIDGVWSEMCYKYKLDKHGVHTITSVVENDHDEDGLVIENMADQWNPEGFTFSASVFELVEPKVDDSFIAVVTKDSVTINDINYPASLIKSIANALNSIQ